jgi:anaerobic magnesium-protoporphyrin IX monomethyl ester cyclase
MRSVLLINPPSTAPNPVMPLGLAYLAACLRQNDIAVEIIDAWAAGISFDKLADEISRRAPAVVGVTMMSPFYGAAMKTVDTVKKNCAAAIIVGGPHPSALPKQCLDDNQHIDFVVIGEGEHTLVELIATLNNAKKTVGDIKGLAYRKNDKIIVTGRAAPIKNLDDLPFPARALLPFKKYCTHPPYGKRNPYMTLITSRGCPYGCSYCSKSVFGRNYRAMSPTRVVAEVKHIVNKYGIREIHFYDDDFTLDMNRAAKICDLITAERLNVSWSCTTRVDLINAGLLKKMKQAGCWLISYGVESGDATILKKVKKGYTLEDIKSAFDLTKRNGIRTVAYFMAGLPGETVKTMQKSIDFSIALKPDFVSWGITALYPGSGLYENAQKNSETVRYTYQHDNGHASGSPYGDGYAILFKESLSRDTLEKHVRRANQAFYLRPAYLTRFLFKIRSFYEFWHYLKGGWQFMRWLHRKVAS